MPVAGKFVVEVKVIEVPVPPVPAVSSCSAPLRVLNTCCPPPQRPVPHPNPNVEPKAPGFIYGVTVAEPDPLTVVPAEERNMSPGSKPCAGLFTVTVVEVLTVSKVQLVRAVPKGVISKKAPS